MMKKIVLLIIVAVFCMNYAYAVGSVTRTISYFNCPLEAITVAPTYKSVSNLVKVTHSLSGFTTSCTVVDKIPDTWIVYAGSINPTVTTKNNVKSVRLIGVQSSTVTYYIGVPDAEPNQRSITSGTFVCDTDTGTTPVAGNPTFYVRDRTCNAPGLMFSGTPWQGEDDHDLDGSGPGCGCPNDCNDNDWFSSPTHPEYWCNLPGGHVVGSSIGVSRGNDDDCSAGPCCRVEQYNVNQAMHYDGWFNKQCGSLDNAEKKVFVNMWLKGVASPPLSEITIAIPTDWSNS